MTDMESNVTQPQFLADLDSDRARLMRRLYALESAAVDYRDTGLPPWLYEALETTRAMRWLAERGVKRVREAR